MKRIKLRLRRYPWDKWFSRKTFTLIQGRDFDCQVQTMTVQIRNAAIRRGKVARLRVKEPVIKVTIQDPSYS